MDEQKMWQWMRENRPPPGARVPQPDAGGSFPIGPTRKAEAPKADDATAADATSASAEATATDTTLASAEAPSAAEETADAEEMRRRLRTALDAWRARKGGALLPEKAETAVPAAPAEPTPPVEESPPRSQREIDEAMEYLEDVLDDYTRLVGNIGHNGFNAPMLLYYRDEVQDVLDELGAVDGLDLQSHWRRTVELDQVVRAHAQEVVDEVGWANFKQYQIINDPPRQHWWWFLDRETRAPAQPAPFWQFWKK